MCQVLFSYALTPFFHFKVGKKFDYKKVERGGNLLYNVKYRQTPCCLG